MGAVKLVRPLLVDANNLIMRQVMAHALEDLQADGVFTGGVYGSIRALRALVSMPEMQFDRVIAIFDNGVPARRLRLLPGYKSARKERRELLSEEDREKAFQQVHQCFELFPYLGVQCLSFKQREADDGVAAAVRAFAGQGVTPVVFSSDADLLQTVGMGAEVVAHRHSNAEEGGTYESPVTVENFHDRIGVLHRCYVLYRTLVGDPSDSIKGAHGCGQKRAADLIEAVLVTAESDLPPGLADLSPVEQLAEVAHYLRHRVPSRSMWQERILADLPRLQRVACGIDLSASFGPTGVLEPRLDEIPSVDPRAFLIACKRLRMKSVLGDPEGYLRPFRTIQQRRVELANG